MSTDPYILAIEFSFEYTAVAVLHGTRVLSNVCHTQSDHQKWGGVVPELASRMHLKNILPVLLQALDQAEVSHHQLSSIAATFGPGLMGSLLVGSHFAKGLSVGWRLPLIAVNHLQGHALSPLLGSIEPIIYPYLSLIISGGHTQIVKVSSPYEMKVLGQSIDDAVGEAFDKIAKMMGLGYPGGPWIDHYALGGESEKFRFTKPKVRGLDFSFSGIKTQFLYFIREKVAQNTNFIEEEKSHLCASIQRALVNILIDKVQAALHLTQIKRLGLGGGVSLNSEVRRRFAELTDQGVSVYLPQKEFTTDNAAMIGLVAYYKFLKQQFSTLSSRPRARLALMDAFE